MCEKEREDGILFSTMRGGVQIIGSMKRKVTLSTEGSVHSPRSFPVADHPTQVPLSLPQLLSRGHVYATLHVNAMQADVAKDRRLVFVILQDFMQALSDFTL